MEPFLFSLITAWALVRYGVTDLVATAKGTESPRYRERAQRLAQQHERQMARLRAGPTIGQAVAARIAHRIAQPKPPRDWSGQRPFRRFLGEWWDDAWNHATESRHRHYERKEAGDLPRQRAARATRDAFGRWRDQRRHRHTETGSAWVPPEADTERTGPIHVVAERLPLPEAATDTEPLPDLGEVVQFPDDRQSGVLDADGTVSTWPASDPDTPHDTTDGSSRPIPSVLHPEGVIGTPEERNTAPMNTPTNSSQQTTPTGEVTNITGALDYTRGMGEQ